jgi:hypothetical protein
MQVFGIAAVSTEVRDPDRKENAMRRLVAVAFVVATFAVAPISSAPATTNSSTTIPFHARIGSILGMIPPASVSTAGGQITNSAPASGSLDYNGGPTMTTNTVYAIYWQPSGYKFPDGYAANINQYFRDLQAASGKNGNVQDVATQYTQGSGSTKTYIQDNTTFAGSTLDTHPLPALDPVNCPDTPVAATNGGVSPPSTTAGCVTDQQVQQEISAVVKANGWPVSNQTEFFMFTAPNIGTCFPATVGVDTGAGVQTQVTAPLCSFSYFCAYHSAYSDSTVDPNSQIIYSNMPYAAQTAGNPLTCDLGSYPNGNPSDPEINVTSHEHNESITDPFGTGWWDSNPNDSAYGEEIGDMCAWDFGNLYGPDGAQYSQTIHGHHYLMQTEWDNSTNGCPGSDSSGNPVPSHRNYDTPEIFLTPDIGYPTAPFKIFGQFFSAGDSVASSFVDSGTTTAVGSSTADASGHFSLMTQVPSSAAAGKATVISQGSSGIARRAFTVPSP